MADPQRDLQAAVERYRDATGEAAAVITGTDDGVEKWIAARSAEDLAKATKKLIDAVSFDVAGINGKGGNGGLTSVDTIRAADEARIALWRHQKAAGGGT